ncbi:penicillin-binding protein 2 [Leucobacter sp. cx-42]|uniref:peptidoglycan D,D-transpeptidase FtsI family protein n=1 Tax=unclassified Leucobacter TaxID=2621730 RepID=UPI00165DED20|nr:MULTISPECIES: penicillin-binding protein 2 [unclassified Leucobacter]MBC9955351.1 penicillin-binding protein 2 [Leucobacter sp. cx-42]
MSRTFRGVPARSASVLIVIVFMALLFAIQLINLQVVSAAAMNEESASKRAVPDVIKSVRGDIVDRNGEVLATTDERYDVQLSPKNTKVNGGSFYRKVEGGGIGTVEVTSAQAFEEIGAITGQSGAEIQKIVDDALEEDPKSDFAYVKRGIDLSQLQQLKALDVDWLTFASHHKRVYPNGAVGGNLVGFSGADEEAQAGIELSQDECLAGVDGEEHYERSMDGVPLPGSVVTTREVQNGGTVELTIDRDLQWQAQQIINTQTESVGAEWGYLTIMDAKTGELLAIAEDGSVDPNDVDASEPDKRDARSYIRPYEPGSTFKAVTAAALIDSGTATPTSQHLTPMRWIPEEGVTFGDSTIHDEMPWTLTGILTESSNVGTAYFGTQMSNEERFEYYQKFGFGISTDSGMPMEDSGLLYEPDEWDRQSVYNITFGQAISSTIIQTAGAYQALANDGVRIPPTLVKSCTSADGTVTTYDHGKPVRAVSEESADTVLRMLETVVTHGWYSDLAVIPGYRIAGKTGTAEQSDGEGGYRPDYVNSFAGIFPADDPQYVAVASIAFPSSGDGGTAAIAAFTESAEATIRAFHVPPSTGSLDPYPIEY